MYIVLSKINNHDLDGSVFKTPGIIYDILHYGGVIVYIKSNDYSKVPVLYIISERLAYVRVTRSMVYFYCTF